MAKKLILKKHIKGIDLFDERKGFFYKDIIDDINKRIDVNYFTVFYAEYEKAYNEAISDVLLMLLYNEKGNSSCDARNDMLDVMYKYRICIHNTAEQNLRNLDLFSACGNGKVFKFTACLNMGLNHFDLSQITKK